MARPGRPGITMPKLLMLLRVTTGLMAMGALVALLGMVCLRSGMALLKESSGVLGCIATLFTSGFTRGTPPREFMRLGCGF